MSRRNFPRVLAVWLAVSLLLGACRASPPATVPAPTSTLAAPATPQPTATITLVPTRTPIVTVTRRPAPTPKPDLGKIQEAIQQTLDLYSRAYTNNDLDLLAQAVDQAPPFWRFVTTRFDNFQKSYAGGQFKFSYVVEDVKLRDYGFVEARITLRGYETYWLFHEQEGKWVLAEPSAEQMGEPKINEQEGFIFHTYAWADDTNAQVMDLMRNARKRVLKVLGQAPDQKATVRVKPVYAIAPFDDPFALAYYSAGYRSQDDQIEIFSPHSYGFSLYDPSLGWEQELEDVLTHEYTHMTHKRNFASAGQTCAWTSEGLAEYVAGSFRASEVRAAVRAGNIIPIVDTTTNYYQQDLNHLYLLKQDRGLAYGFSVALVSFVVKNHGGLDGFWKLASACDKNVKFEDAVLQALGVTFDKFDRDWRDWLKKYGSK